MAVKVKNIIPTKFAENVQTTQYQADAPTTIDKFTITNTSGSVVNFSCNLVLSGAAEDSNLVIKNKAVAAGETYVCPELVGHSLEAGSFISTIADTSNALTIRASGRVIT